MRAHQHNVLCKASKTPTLEIMCAVWLVLFFYFLLFDFSGRQGQGPQKITKDIKRDRRLENRNLQWRPLQVCPQLSNTSLLHNCARAQKFNSLHSQIIVLAVCADDSVCVVKHSLQLSLQGTTRRCEWTIVEMTVGCWRLVSQAQACVAVWVWGSL